MRSPPPLAVNKTAISLPSVGGAGQAQRVIAVNLARVMGMFSLTTTLREPRRAMVFSWLEAVNHNGFWSKPSIANSHSSSSNACKVRTRIMLHQNTRKRWLMTCLGALNRKFAMRADTPPSSPPPPQPTISDNRHVKWNIGRDYPRFNTLLLYAHQVFRYHLRFLREQSRG